MLWYYFCKIKSLVNWWNCCIPVFLDHSLLPYICRKTANSRESDSPRPRKTLICAKNMGSSSYNPRTLLQLSAIRTPIFSNDWSSNHHVASSSVSPHSSLAFFTSDFKNLHSVDFPQPVGMQIPIHRMTGSIHSVDSSSTVEWDMENLTTSRRPARTASGGTLIAFPTWWQPCKNQKMQK